jgi:hypothetical protein
LNKTPLSKTIIFFMAPAVLIIWTLLAANYPVTQASAMTLPSSLFGNTAPDQLDVNLEKKTKTPQTTPHFPLKASSPARPLDLPLT